MDQLPPNWINLGIAGLLAVAFIGAHLHTIKVTIPSLLERFGLELAAERAANASHIEKLLARLENVEGAIRELVSQAKERVDREDRRERPFGPRPHYEARP